MKPLQLHKPHLLVVVGLPGAGKTYFASQFSDTFNAPYINYGFYAKHVGNEKVAEELATHALMQLLKTKQTIVIEGVGNTRDDRREIVRVASKHGYDVLYIWVQTEPQTTEQRAVRSKMATMTRDEYEERIKKFELLLRTEAHVVISGKHTYASQAKTVLKRLATDRPAPASVPVPVRSTSSRGRLVR
jgi:predicted kinase